MPLEWWAISSLVYSVHEKKINTHGHLSTVRWVKRNSGPPARPCDLCAGRFFVGVVGG